MKHKKIKNRLFGTVLLLLIVAAVFIALYINKNVSSPSEVLQSNAKKETIRLWYTDDELTDYLNSKALQFYEDTDIRVEVSLTSGLEYLEAINKASLDDDTNTPDIYILSNDSLEKAYLAGLATELDQSLPVYDTSVFNDTARNAVTYKGKYVGCPMYYETSALLYNKTYLDEIGEDLIPTTIADILNFADQYSAPENVEAFFSWDVSDIFYNYFFIGDYISVGGHSGDDDTDIDIYNKESVSTLKVYQELNQFFSIDTKESSYENTMQDFQDGKIIYTIATSDCLKRLDEAAANGEFEYEYGVAKLPDINSELSTRGMSVTNALVINGYSTHKESAGKLMDFLINSASDDLYSMTGKLSAVTKTSYDSQNLAAFMENYADSEPMPKLLETGNFWVELEICFAKVWDGEDANTILRTLSEQIKTQLAGEAVTETPIDDPEVELLPAVGYEEGTGELDGYEEE